MLIHIVSVNSDNYLGINSTNQWFSREDLRLFREKTFNHVVIVSKSSFKAVKKLKHRCFIVVSSKRKKDHDNIRFVKNIDEALSVAKEMDCSDDIYVLGGSKVYEETSSHIEKIILSKTPGLNGSKEYKIPAGFFLKELIGYKNFDLYLYEKKA